MKKNKNADENVAVNREHKDSVFSLLFSNPDVLRELYSAIEGIDLPLNIPININTLSNVLVREQMNDISFNIDNRLVVLIEHQSTVNNNMPLRLLMYIARIYEKIIDRKKTYQKKLEKIPCPEFIVLYNGDDPYPDHKELRLSSAFKNAKDLEGKDKEMTLELIVQIYNINQGHNEKILKKSEVLGDYSFFIDNIRECQKKDFSLETAVESAIKYCIDNNKLKDFLEKHGSEVRNMLITEYNRDEEMEVVREEGREEGLITTARNALAEGLPLAFVQKITGLDREIIEQLAGRN